MDENTRRDLKKMEESLWRPETRFDDTLMDSLFARDFVEFGRSGRIYRRDEMLLGKTVARKSFRATLPLHDFRARLLSESVAQVTYISEVCFGAETERANRSSIWRKDAGCWKLCFHQGTPVD